MTSPHALADPRLPTAGRCARCATADGGGLAPSGGVGRPPGQHAPRRAPVHPRAGRRDGAVDLGGPLARPGLGPAVQRLCRRGARPRGVHPRSSPGRRGRPSVRAGPRRPARGVPRRAADAVWRCRRRPGDARQPAQVCRTDGSRRVCHGTAPASRWSGRCLPRRWIPGMRGSSSRGGISTYSDQGHPTRSRSGRGSARHVASPRSRHWPGELTPVRTPIGDAWILASDEPAFLASGEGSPAAARLLPSGDTWYLLQGRDRELLVPDAARRGELWTSRVWPGAVLVAGDVVGTWRRAQAKVSISPWRSLSPAERAAVEAEAASMPLPGSTGTSPSAGSPETRRRARRACFAGAPRHQRVGTTNSPFGRFA